MLLATSSPDELSPKASFMHIRESELPPSSTERKPRLPQITPGREHHTPAMTEEAASDENTLAVTEH